jgi:hypothetical protein
MGAQNFVYPYLVGVSEASSPSSVRGKAQRAASDTAAAPAAAAASVAEHQRARRRRSAAPKDTDRGYRYEYLDTESETGASSNGNGQATSTMAYQGVGPLGFAGTAVKPEKQRVAGLTTLTGDGFGGGPSVPIRPSSWQVDPDEPGGP